MCVCVFFFCFFVVVVVVVVFVVLFFISDLIPYLTGMRQLATVVLFNS